MRALGTQQSAPRGIPDEWMSDPQVIVTVAVASGLLYESRASSLPSRYARALNAMHAAPCPPHFCQVPGPEAQVSSGEGQVGSCTLPAETAILQFRQTQQSQQTSPGCRPLTRVSFT